MLHILLMNTNRTQLQLNNTNIITCSKAEISLPENHKVVTTSYNLMERLFNFVEGVQTHP